MTDKRSGFGGYWIAILALGLVLVLTVGWLLYKNVQEADNISSFDECVAGGYPVAESYPEQCSANGKTYTNPEQDIGSIQSTSGQGGFSVAFPTDWGTNDITRVLDSDWYFIFGTEQPESLTGKPTKIVDTESLGTDAASVFSILLADKSSAVQPEDLGMKEYAIANDDGIRGDIYIGDKDNQIFGKKYIKEYTRDELVGIGSLRTKGNRDYLYVFDLTDGRQLRVSYSTWPNDPRDLSEEVDRMVNSITIH